MLINRLLNANCDVYWLKKAQTVDGQDLGTGAIWVPASASALAGACRRRRRKSACPSYALAKAPKGDAMKLKPIRIGLYDSLRRHHAVGLDALAVRAVRIPVHRWSIRRRSMRAI